MYRDVSKRDIGYFYVGNQVVYDEDFAGFGRKLKTKRNIRSISSLIRKRTPVKNRIKKKEKSRPILKRPFSAKSLSTFS